jgi:hypothetical protein
VIWLGRDDQGRELNIPRLGAWHSFATHGCKTSAFQSEVWNLRLISRGFDSQARVVLALTGSNGQEVDDVKDFITKVLLQQC